MANSPLGTVLYRLRTILDPEDAEATDRELLRRLVAVDDQAAFEELVRRHGPMILGVCRRLLGDAHGAEDAFQAVFLVLVRWARAVPWRESLGGWLHGTARHVALRAKARAGLRRDRRQPRGIEGGSLQRRRIHRLCDGPMPCPAAGRRPRRGDRVRIANVSEKPVMVNQMDTAGLSLAGPDGKAREWHYQRLR